MKKLLFLLIFFLIPLLSISQLLTTTWNTGCYYNYYQPQDSQGPCGKCFVSSTSSAMGQVMKYWKHPNKGWGEMTIDPYLYEPQYANFEHFYYWDSMPNSINSNNFHISRFLSDLEVSITTNYSPYFYNYSCGLVNLDTVRIAMNTHFGYKNGTVIHRNTNQNFDNLIINEVNEGRPVIMEIYPYNNQCSRFCVVDGYNPSNQKFHINWGYGNEWNIWSELDTIPFIFTNWGLQTHALIGLEPDTMEIEINIMYDQTTNSIPSIITINNSTYYCTNGELELNLKKNWYPVIITTTEPWNYVNSSDALTILKHFVGMTTLNGLKLQCANVNSDVTINSLDALMTSKRFVQVINSFIAGDWKFENKQINSSGIWKIYGRCVGDTN